MGKTADYSLIPAKYKVFTAIHLILHLLNRVEQGRFSSFPDNQSDVWELQSTWRSSERCNATWYTIFLHGTAHLFNGTTKCNDWRDWNCCNMQGSPESYKCCQWTHKLSVQIWLVVSNWSTNHDFDFDRLKIMWVIYIYDCILKSDQPIAQDSPHRPTMPSPNDIPPLHT